MRTPWLLLVLTTLAIGLLHTASAWWTGDFPGQSVDLYGTVWFFGHMADSMAHLRSPGFTDQMFFPEGIDLFARTGSHLVDAGLAAPLWWVLGPAAALCAWVTLLPTLNGLALAWAARARLDPATSCAVGALGASCPLFTYELMNGRPTQAFVAPAALALGAWLRQHDVRSAVLAGLALALTGWSYWFYGYFLGLGLLVWSLPDLRSRTPWVALGVTALAVAPAAVPMALAAHAGEVPGLGTETVGLDEPRMVWQALGEGPRLLGPVWVALALLALGGGWRWAVLVALGLVLASGPELVSDVPNPLYVALHHGAPFFARLWFPCRALVLVALAAPVGTALLLGRWPRWRTPVLVLLTAASLGWTAFGQGRLPLRHTDATEPPAYRWLSDQGGALVPLPFPDSANAIVWQPFHHLPMYGGMGNTLPGHWPEDFAAQHQGPVPQALASVHTEAPAARLDPGELDAFAAQGFRWVVLHPELLRQPRDADKQLAQRTRATIRALTRLLGPPVVTDDRIWVWQLDDAPLDVPPRLRATDARLDRL